MRQSNPPKTKKKKMLAHVELLELEDEGVADGLQLCGDDGQDRHVDTVELVKTSPCSALTHSGQNLPDSLHNNPKLSEDRMTFRNKN